MRRTHLAAGLLTTAAFLLTGQFMLHHQPPLPELPAATRLLYRSRHIYLLAAGLINLTLGLYLTPAPTRRRTILQTVGSVPILISPILLLLAFATEPAAPFQPDSPTASAGLIALFAGCMLHLLAAGRTQKR